MIEGNRGHGGERYPRRWLAAAAMIGAATMALIDITIVNVALPTIRSDLDASGTQLQWVVSAYMLTRMRSMPLRWTASALAPLTTAPRKAPSFIEQR
jgi:MFS family permease